MSKRIKASSIAIAAAFLVPSAAESGTVVVPFQPSSFSHPLAINNPYFPLVAGTTYIYKEAMPEGCEVDVSAVTYSTRVIDRVTTRLVHDQVFDGSTCTTADSALTEDTSDYYAQDDKGNVWYMGEDTFECQGKGHCTPGEGGWIGGVNGAQPGLIMLASPKPGNAYQQEYQQGVAEDRALVFATNQIVRMTRPDAYRPSYMNCLVTKETTRLEPGTVETKAYCPQIGNVLTVEGKNLRSELVSISGSANALRFRTPPGH